MDENEKNLTEKESLALITDMINKARHHFHENGTSAILWGTVVGIAGLLSFAEQFWDFYIGFNIWWMVMAAVIPQVIITIREHRLRKVISHTEAAINTVWLVYGISMFALIFYSSVVPGVTDKILSREGISLLRVSADGSTSPQSMFIASSGSLFLLLYAIPTMTTGIVSKFRPMIWASVLCYLFFIISCFTESAYDLLLNGLAGIFNWLIPGFILRKTFYKRQKAMNV